MRGVLTILLLQSEAGEIIIHKKGECGELWDGI